MTSCVLRAVGLLAVAVAVAAVAPLPVGVAVGVGLLLWFARWLARP